MAFKNAQQSRILAGSLHYSGYAKGVDLGLNVDMLDTTTLLDTAMQFITGQDTSTFSFDLLLDTVTTAGGEWSNATTWKSNDTLPVTYAPSGLVAGSECFMVQGLETTFATTSAPNQAVMATLAGQTNGATDAGLVVEDLTAITTTTNGTARDHAAGSTNGGIAFIHSTAFSGLTSNTVTIEHSTTGVGAWSTIATFTAITGLTSQAVVVAPATTVNRYLRVVDTVVGTGSNTRAVTFARR